MNNLQRRLGRWAWILSVFLTCAANAQSYQLDWWSAEGGGAGSGGAGGNTSTGGVYAVSGTLVQAVAEGSSGGTYTAMGGFWGVAVVQTPAAPLLTIRPTATNTVMLSWPAQPAGYTLQQNPEVTSTNWTAAPQPVADNGTTKTVIVRPPALGRMFYRLWKSL